MYRVEALRWQVLSVVVLLDVKWGDDGCSLVRDQRNPASRRQAAGKLVLMLPAEGFRPDALTPWVCLTMKLITAVILLTLGSAALGAHHVEAAGVAVATPISSGVSAGVNAADVIDSVTAPDNSFTAPIVLCVFVFLCCVMVAASFSLRRSKSRVLLAIAPRYPPTPAVKLRIFAPRPSLSQLSISRT